MRCQLLLVVVLFAGFSLRAQNFSNQANAQLLNVPIGNPIHGSGLSFFDFNQDGWDDLTIATEESGTYLYVNNDGNYSLLEILPNDYEGKAVVWGDYNNDGYPDLFVGSYLGPSQLWEQSDDGFENVADDAGIPSDPLAMTYGAAWGDYNQNGRLDLYICNYNQGVGPTNWLLRNNGNGTFTEVASNVGVDNGVVWSFMPCWADFNNDGWPDLYVINDKAAPNALFRNNGNGTFTDISEQSNTDIVIDAMSNSVTDFDNDGDLDIYVTNDFGGNVLYRNDGDFVFTNVTEEYGASVYAFCWGASWIDFDNDTDDDLFICTANAASDLNPFYRMVIDQPLTLSNSVFSPPNSISSYSVAKGDYDRNGFPDLLHSNSPASTVSLWRNNGGSNNWVGITLQAIVSNPGAIGSWVHVCSGGDCRVRYTHAGEAFMGQNSQHLLFGLALDTLIDSVVVEWPSGHTDTIYNPEINTYHTISEGETYPVEIIGDTVICEGGSTTLTVAGYNNVIWSNEEVSTTIEVDTAGSFQVAVLTSFGFYAESSVVDVVFDIPPDLSFSVTPPTCHNTADASVLLNAGGSENYTVFWNGEEGADVANNLAPGELQIEFISQSGCSYVDSLFIPNPPPVSIAVDRTDLLCADSNDGSITLIAEGGTGTLTVSPAETLNGLPAGEYLFTIFDENSCSIDTLIQCLAPPAIEVDLVLSNASEVQIGSANIDINGGTPPYAILWSNGNQDETYVNLSPGTYWLNITDAQGCSLIYNFEILLETTVAEYEMNQIVVYPNPSFNDLYVRGISPPFQIQLFNQMGRLCSQNYNQSGHFSIIGLPAGCYQMLIIKDQKYFRQSVVIE